METKSFVATASAIVIAIVTFFTGIVLTHVAQ